MREGILRAYVALDVTDINVQHIQSQSRMQNSLSDVMGMDVRHMWGTILCAKMVLDVTEINVQHIQSHTCMQYLLSDVTDMDVCHMRRGILVYHMTSPLVPKAVFGKNEVCHFFGCPHISVVFWCQVFVYACVYLN